MSRSTRRALLAATLLTIAHAAGIPTAGAASPGSDFPNKPIRVIVPVTAGGSTDVIARMVCQRMSEILNRPIVVDNRPGAGSIIGTDLVAKSQPDGYTLLMAFATHVATPFMTSKLPYDPVRDFQPISLLATQPLVLIVNPNVPARSLKELIALAKAQPGKLNFGMASTGSASHIAGEAFKIMTGTDIVGIPYPGAAPAQQALAGNQVQLMFANIQTAIGLMKINRAVPLGSATDKRSSFFPDVPTLGEQGLPAFEVEPWQGIIGPRGMPKHVVDTLHKAAAQAVRAPDMLEKLAATGSTPVGSTPAEFEARIAVQMKVWGEVIRKAGIKVE